MPIHRSPSRPNIIFIVADDLGFADLGCYGGRAPVSPVLDSLAAARIKFTQGYSNSPVCSPTRFALMTARYQYRLRGAAEEPINSKARTSTVLGLPPEHPTCRQCCRQRATAPRLWANGTWATGLHLARRVRVTTSFLDPCPAELTTLPIAIPQACMISGLGNKKKRKPGAVDCALANSDCARPRQRPALHDDGLVGNHAGRCWRERPCRLPAGWCAIDAGTASCHPPLSTATSLAHEPSQPARAA